MQADGEALSVRLQWASGGAGGPIGLFIGGTHAAMGSVFALVGVGGVFAGSGFGGLGTFVFGMFAVVGGFFAINGGRMVLGGLSETVNHTVLRLRGGQLSVSNRPIPWPRTKSLLVAQITSVFYEEAFRKRRFGLRARMEGGEEMALGPERWTEATAFWAARLVDEACSRGAQG